MSFVFRFNTINGPEGNVSPQWVEQHGSHVVQPGGFGAEVYENTFDLGANTRSVAFTTQRGGKWLVFNNDVTWDSPGGATMWVMEEHPDSEGLGEASSLVNGQPQHASDSYYWNNLKGGSLFGVVLYTQTGTATGGTSTTMTGTFSDICSTDCDIYGVYLTGGTGSGQFRRMDDLTTATLTVDTAWDTNPDATTTYRIEKDSDDAIAEDSEFWNEDASYDGTSGVGKGVLASRPATCTEGTAYWATDQGDWNSEGNDGVLYICGSSNWTDATTYEPYDYPHPLRGETVSEPTAKGTTFIGCFPQ